MSEQLYEPVRVVNTTGLSIVGGCVDYSLGAFCEPDFFTLKPHEEWSAKKRGICLLRSISATVIGADGTKIAARDYESSGTGVSRFEIVETGLNQFAVRQI